MASYFRSDLMSLVKGLRSCGSGNEQAYLSKSIQEIKEELKGRDIGLKAEALKKLIYLKMLGNDMSWAAFTVIEVMSQDRFSLKRTGFLAAAQSFTATTDVLLLCVQLLKKEFTAKSPWEIGTAISTLACMATEDLSRDLLGDVVQMLTSSRVYIKKKATLVLYKLYVAYPQGLRLTFDHLKRKLSDESPSVVCCAVNVIAELARKKPSNYLNLAPEFFALLTTTSSNWMLIKVIKLLGSLVGEEPRLARKLLEPLATLIQTTPAKSVQYEAINCITVALQHTKKADGSDAKNVPTVVRLCTDRLRELVRDPDQNLKYLGLVGLVGLMKSAPRVVAEHRELVLACLLDEDVTIRLRALELVCGMCTRRNLPDIVDSLLGNLESAEGHYRDELIAKIIFMCSRDKYAYLADFAWYVEVLCRLASMEGTHLHAATVANQLVDVTVRVEEVRPTAMGKLLPMLADATLMKNARMVSVSGSGSGAGGSGEEEGGEGSGSAAAAAAGAAGATAGAEAEGTGFGGSGAVLTAAAWIVGEFCSIIPPRMHAALMDDLLAPAVTTLPPQLQAAYVQCLLKVLSCAAGAAVKAGGEAAAAFLSLSALQLTRLNTFAQSKHVEVQERACLVQQLLATLGVPFVPLETPSSIAAAAAKAEADLMALMGEGGGAASAASASSSSAAASPTPAAPAARPPPPPLDPDVKLISALLAGLFAEQLKPVNARAQRRVPLPPGLDLDAVITPGYTAGEGSEDKGSGFNPSLVSFEDSYGIQDDEFAGRGKKGVSYDMSGGGDAEDEAWFSAMAKKNKRRDHELWGTELEEEEEEGGKRKKGGKKGERESAAAAAASAGGKKGTSSRRNDPFLLGSGGPSRSRAATEDVDSIPIKALAPGELSSKKALDPSIFGDFGGGAAGKKGSKRSSKKGGKDEDAPSGRQFRVISDEDFPEGTGKEEGGSGGGGGGAMSKMADALSSIDLSTPLGEDEVLPTHKHRSVPDKAGGGGGAKKSGGRARVLVAGSTPAAAAAPEVSAGKKEKKGEKEEKKEKKEKKDKTSSSSSSSSSSAAAAAPAPAPEKAKKAAKAVKVTLPADLACAEPYAYPLVSDKVISVTYSLSGATPAAAVAGAALGGGGSSSAAAGLLTFSLRIEAKSSKKSVEWVEAVFGASESSSSGGSASFTPALSELAPGSTPSAVRLVSGLKPKEKGAPKAPAKRATLSAAFTSASEACSLPCTIFYKVEGSDKVVALEVARVAVPAPALLVASAITREEYQALMTGASGASFHGAVGHTPLLSASLPATMAAVLGILRASAVSQSDKHAILFSKTVSGELVTVLVKEDAGDTLLLTVKSQLSEGHAEALLAGVVEAIAAAIKAASAKKEDKE